MGRYANDRAALQVIQGQNPTPAPDFPPVGAQSNVYQFVPAYELSKPYGRLIFKRGGPQSATRTFKDAAYRGIPDLHNYDIASCHTEALRHLVDEARADGVDVSANPLDDYIGAGGKRGAAARHGLPVGLVKRAEHAVKYGASLPETKRDALLKAQRTVRRCGGSIHDRQAVVDHIPEIAMLAHRADVDTDEALRALRAIFLPIRRLVQQLGCYLCGIYWERRKQSGGPGGSHVKNAAGVAINLYSLDRGHERASTMMAWYLQGLESAHVHALTALSDDYGYEVVGNEHDGLITIGAIPAAAEDEARQMSGFSRARLVEKWFVDQGKADAEPARRRQAA
jgi:hypothetical protein